MECLKRSLIGADPQELTIRLKLAHLYADLNEKAESISYHQHVVELCISASRSQSVIPVGAIADITSDKPVSDYAMSAVRVARYHLDEGGDDLELAKRYMERVASSNAEEVRTATELLKRIQLKLGQRSDMQQGVKLGTPDLDTSTVSPSAMGMS